MGLDVNATISEYVREHGENSNGLRDFIDYLKQSFREGKLNHNSIRKVVLQRFEAKDQPAVFLGSLLLQMDNKDIYTVVNEQL